MLKFELKSQNSNGNDNNDIDNNNKNSLITLKYDNKKYINDEMWIDKYRPKTISELAMYKPKVEKIKTWILNAINNNVSNPYMLALCGASGTCKSTVVEVICQELGISVIEWSDDMEMEPYLKKEKYEKLKPNEYITNTKNISNDSMQSNQLSINMIQDLIGEMDKYSRIDSKFNEFILESSYPSLQFTNLKDKKNTPPHKKRKSNNNNVVSLISDDDDDDDNNNNKYNSKFSTNYKEKINQRKVVLIHDPSFLSKTNKSGVQLQDLLLSFRIPVIMIVGNVSGKDDEKYNLDKILSQSIRDQLNFESIYCPDITDLNISKILTNILTKEKVSKDSYKPELLRSIAAKSMGDLRNAIMQLQIMTNNRKLNTGTYISDADIFDQKLKKDSKKKSKSDKENESDNKGEDKRDDEIKGVDKTYAPLHAVAKIVNSKLNASGLLEFDPDQVINRTDMANDMVVSFIQWNVIGSISNSQRVVNFGINDGNDEDMVQIYSSLRYFSDIDVLGKAKYDPSAMLDRSDNCYPDEYINSISARSPSVSRGLGMKEKYDLGKNKGASNIFIPMYRPGVIDLFHTRNRIMTNAILLRNELACSESFALRDNSTNNSNPNIPMMHSFDELVVTIIPLLRVLTNVPIHKKHSVPLSEIVCWRLRTLSGDTTYGKSQISDNEKVLEEQKLLHDDDITEFDE